MKSINRLKWLTLISLPLTVLLQFFSHVLQDNNTISQIAYVLSKVLFVSVPLLFWLLLRKPIIEKEGSKRRFAILSGLALSILIFAFLYTMLDVIRPFGASIHETLSVLGLAQNFLLYSAFIIVFNSLFEELFWRYAMFGGLKEMMSVRQAMILSSAGFAAMHLLYYVGLFKSVPVIILLTLATFCLGMFWAWLYEKTKSIPHVWLNHMLVNIPLFGIEYLIIS